MSGKQKECGYSWTSEGEIHTCSLHEGHTGAHICGFVFSPTEYCLKRVDPTPPEGEAVPEQRDKCIRCGAEECGHGKCPNCDFKCRKCLKLAADAAPVVSTAAPEPPIEMIAGTHNKKEDAASASPQSARDRTEPTGQPEPVSRCNLQSSELAPESYKPAEGPRVDGWLGSILRDAASKCERMKLAEADNYSRYAATPVTVEAPSSDIARQIAICEENGTKWAHFKVAEIKQLLATPKPIGDVEAVARQIYLETEGFTPLGKQHFQCTKADQVEIDKIKAILSPFFAPEPPCSECATLQDKLEIAQRYGQREYAIEQILRGDLSTAVAECATLRKERDDYEKAIAKALRFTPSEEEPEECAPWMVEAEPEPMGPFSLIEAITAMMEMFDREFSKADKRGEAAEAQLSTLRDELLKSRQLKNKLLKSLSRKHRQQGQRAQELDQLKRKLAALAPTPEVSPHMTKVSAGIFTSTLCTCLNQNDEDGAHCPICGRLKPVNGVAPKE